MTRKHFQSLADALSRQLQAIKHEGDTVLLLARLSEWVQSVKGVASACNEHNGRFDYHTFYNACGMNEAESLVASVEDGSYLASQMVKGN